MVHNATTNCNDARFECARSVYFLKAAAITPTLQRPSFISDKLKLIDPITGPSLHDLDVLIGFKIEAVAANIRRKSFPNVMPDLDKLLAILLRVPVEHL